MGSVLPKLNEIKSAQDMTSTFYGYDNNLSIRDGAFRDMQNLTGDLYPLATVRKARGRVRALTKAHGLFALNGLGWVDGTTLYHNGTSVTGLTLADNDKTFVTMGAYVCIFPDKIMYNTADGTHKQMDVSFEHDSSASGALPLEVVLTRVDGTSYDDVYVGDTEPERENGKFWLDTTGGEQILRVYSSAYSAWQSVSSSYIKLTADGIGANIAEMDTVTLTETPIGEGETHEFLNGSYTVYARSNNYIVIPGVFHNGTEVAVDISCKLKVERKMPDMDYVCEHENRLFGCSSANHEIYCSALGDPTNWNRFLGISTDSYAATVGSPGPFTGCVSHGGYVLFFKEDRIHKLYGAYPSKFQLTDTACRGVEQGSSNSLVAVNENLLYKSEFDVCAYTSASPSNISAALGETKYSNAWAGVYNGKYYMSAQKDTCKYDFLVYNSYYGLWHREDGTNAKYFANDGKDLYFLDGNIIRSVNGTLDALYKDSQSSTDNDIEWYAETGDICSGTSRNRTIASYANSRHVGKIQFRIEIEEESMVRLETQYDGSGQWEEVYRMNATRKRTLLANIIPHRCDNMRIRISGYGAFKLYSITKTYEVGAEV